MQKNAIFFNLVEVFVPIFAFLSVKRAKVKQKV